nr:zinc finger protein CONSTANS-LIKE 4 [Ipomoea batatas]
MRGKNVFFEELDACSYLGRPEFKEVDACIAFGQSNKNSKSLEHEHYRDNTVCILQFSVLNTRSCIFKPRNHLIRYEAEISHGLPLLADRVLHCKEIESRDSCKRALATVFCHADTAFLYVTCDSKIHTAALCEQAPASFTCKVDAAVLSVTCDCDYHSVNGALPRLRR